MLLIPSSDSPLLTGMNHNERLGPTASQPNHTLYRLFPPLPSSPAKLAPCSCTTCGLTLRTHRCAWLGSCTGVCVMDIYRSSQKPPQTQDWLLSAGPAQRAGFNLKPPNSIIITAGCRGWCVCACLRLMPLRLGRFCLGEILSKEMSWGNRQRRQERCFCAAP